MYIKNQTFSDEETLLEMLFDFALGEPAPLVAELRKEIAEALEKNEPYVQYRATLGEEDRLELEAEEQDLRLSEALMNRFGSFKVQDRKLYGIGDSGETLLFEMDFV
jgi:hypothetical protein